MLARQQFLGYLPVVEGPASPILDLLRNIDHYTSRERSSLIAETSPSASFKTCAFAGECSMRFYGADHAANAPPNWRLVDLIRFGGQVDYAVRASAL